MKFTWCTHAIAVTCFCTWAVGPVIAPSSLSAVSPAGDESEEQRTVGIFQRLAPATLFLSASYDSAHPLTSPSGTGVGAGFIADEDGRVLTNAHVVDGASVITVTLYDGTQVKAELLGLDPLLDVAVLQLPSSEKPFTPVEFGDSDHLKVGQHTLIVGSPFGLGFTLTSGIISGLGPAKSGHGTGNGYLIQTTAPINPGNSGGPLVDSRGQVIGMTTATLMGAQNIGFAIPINVAKNVLAELKRTGKIERPWLGVTGQFVTDDVMKLFALPLRKGLLVVDVNEGGPAAEAGLRAGTLHVSIEGQGWILGGDIIVSVGGQRVPTAGAFVAAVKTLHIGQEVAIEIVRDGERLQGSVIVGELPAGSLKPKHGPGQQPSGTMFSGTTTGRQFAAPSF